MQETDLQGLEEWTGFSGAKNRKTSFYDNEIPITPRCWRCLIEGDCSTICFSELFCRAGTVPIGRKEGKHAVEKLSCSDCVKEAAADMTASAAGRTDRLAKAIGDRGQRRVVAGRDDPSIVKFVAAYRFAFPAQGAV